MIRSIATNRLLVAVALTLIPVVALANAAMGLGLERWAPVTWLAYVVGMVLWEAWFLRRLVAGSWKSALITSLAANFITGIMCGLGGLLAPFLHGSSVNPNPLLDTVLLLCVFALPSGLFECVAWSVAKPRVSSAGAIFGRVLGAHALGVPIGFAILFAFPEPYGGLQQFTRYARRDRLMRFVRVIESRSEDLGRIKSPADLEAALVRTGEPGDWAAAYVPEFKRFDIGEARRHPIEWNFALPSLRAKPDLDRSNWRWLVRFPGVRQTVWIDLNSEVTTSSDLRPSDLDPARGPQELD